jgi:hypothetical protein
MRHTLVAPTFEGRDRGIRFVSAPLDVGQFPGLVEEQLLGTVEPTQGLERAVRPSSEVSGSRRGSHPPAPTDPGVTISRHRALVILTARNCAPMPNGRRAWDVGG